MNVLIVMNVMSVAVNVMNVMSVVKVFNAMSSNCMCCSFFLFRVGNVERDNSVHGDWQHAVAPPKPHSIGQVVASFSNVAEQHT